MTDWSLDFGCAQHQGSRRYQEDYFGSFDPEPKLINDDKGFAAVIADGMGGHDSGGKASILAVNAFLESYRKKTPQENIQEALGRALYTANQGIVERNTQKGENSGTTLVGAIIQSNCLFWVSVGDSHLYLLRDGQLTIINEDHSFGAEIDRRLRSGQLTAEEAKADEKRRNQLTSFLGVDPIPKIDISTVPVELKPGDRILLCTDGLTDTLTREEIAEVISAGSSAQDRCEELIRQTIGRNAPNQDNTTLILLETNAPKVKTLPLGNGKVIGGTLAILVALLLGYMYLGKPQVDMPQPPTTESTSTTDGSSTPTTETSIPTTATTTPAPPTTTGSQADQAEEQFRPTEHQIKVVQWFLEKTGQYNGSVDGKIGEKTREAIKRFQNGTEGLARTGKLDRKTYQKIEAIINSKQGMKKELDEFTNNGRPSTETDTQIQPEMPPELERQLLELAKGVGSIVEMSICDKRIDELSKLSDKIPTGCQDCMDKINNIRQRLAKRKERLKERWEAKESALKEMNSLESELVKCKSHQECTSCLTKAEQINSQYNETLNIYPDVRDRYDKLISDINESILYQRKMQMSMLENKINEKKDYFDENKNNMKLEDVIKLKNEIGEYTSLAETLECEKCLSIIDKLLKAVENKITLLKQTNSNHNH